MRRPSSSERGLTFVSVLMLLAVLGAGYWCFAFGPIYYDNHEVKQILREAATSAYRQSSDAEVRKGLLKLLTQSFGYSRVDAQGRPAAMNKLEFDEQNDIRLERSANPPVMRIDMHYARTFNLPIFGGQRRVSFDDHVEQDISAVKW